MSMEPPLVLEDIERSHRLGPSQDREGRPRVRPVSRVRSSPVPEVFAYFRPSYAAGRVILFPINAPAWAVLNCLISWAIVND